MSSPPGSKLVRRGDLDSQGTPSAPRSPDQNLETRFREQLEQLYHLEDHSSETAIAANILNGNGVPPRESLQDEDGKSYDFRLFAKPTGNEESRDIRLNIARIALRTPSPLNGEPGFINPHRPEGYYFTKHPNAEEVQRFNQAAISGEDVLEGLRTRWPGLEKPWRVTVIRTSKQPSTHRSIFTEQSPSEKRKRSGKKRRIALRKKIAAKTQEEVKRRHYQAEKEIAEREKRTARNREKKVKKKLKDKMKKSQETQTTA